MSLAFNKGSVVASPGQQIAFSDLLSVSSSNNPNYIVVSGLDRLEYTAASNGNSGTISGNGHSTGFSDVGGDGTGFGILFTYNVATGRYVNSTYGSLSSLVMTASTDKNRNETLSFYGSNDASVLAQYQNDPVGLAVYASSSYLGTLDVVTQPAFGTVPSQATPNSIAAIAQTFVGQAWNNSGCWVLACNIAAEAGASLPVASTLTGISGQANGEWMVAYDGPGGSTGSFQSMLRTGDIVVFNTASGGGHITTVASGSGAGAQLIDNIEYVDQYGNIANSANDGSANDVTIAPAHAAAGEFSGVDPSTVVIYRLDTPVLTASVGAANLSSGQSLSLASVLRASDPAGKAITTYQVYDTATQDSFSVGGSTLQAASAVTALTLSASAFASAGIVAGTGMSSVTSGTLMVRAYNGSYWGDWTSLSVTNTPAHVRESAASLVNDLAALNTAAIAGTLQSIVLTDAGKPTLSLNGTMLSQYRSVIDRIEGAYVLSITADSGTSTLNGGRGTNQISAKQTTGNYTLNAGASVNGHDTLYGGQGADILNGSTSASGAALLIAGSGSNVLNGGLGADTLYGGGRSLMTANAANQVLLGGYTSTSRDTMSGAAGGHDLLAVARGNNLLNAGAGTGTVLEGGAGADRLYGSSAAGGSAVLIAGSGANTVTGGLGADSLVGGGASLLKAGTASVSQVLLGGYSANAHDTLDAGSNNAVLAVANGSNLLRAGTGHATMFGGAGNDVLTGGGGAAVMVGGSGHSTLQAGSGGDTLVGGGQSLLIGGSGAAGTSVLLGGFSSGAHDTLQAGTGNGEILAVAQGNNVLRADPAGLGSYDTLVAGTGDDTLYGAGGGATTTYIAGIGNTAIRGGAGSDNLVVQSGQGHVSFDGGAGTNTVTFAGASDAAAWISTSASGETTITFSGSAQSVTLDNVASVAFANGAVHQLAA
jgi:Ca2+-binding RTX toxin-like protein